MNDRERISRLVGAAISECSSSRLNEVRLLLVRAARALGEVAEERKDAVVSQMPSFKGMTRAQRDAALEAIEGMIDGERSKEEGERADLFG